MLFGALLQLNAQNTTQPISLNIRNATIQDFIKQIESLTKFSFIYRDVLMDSKKDITIQVKEKPLAEVVQVVLDQKGLEASYNNNTIVITSKSRETESKTKLVKGVVKDDNGEPIIGATVVDSETQNGTITDYNGNFSLEAREGSVLKISYIGFSQVDIKVGQ